MNKNIKWGGLAVGAILVVACGRGEQKGPYYASTTSARIIGNDAAVERITAARCEREKMCNDIGPDKSYATLQACMNELGHDKAVDLRKEECPSGVAEADLSDCLTDIRNEKCGNPFDSVSRSAACRRGKLCVGK